MKNKYIGVKDVIEKFGVKPNRVIDVQALAGDSSDNVPGAPGIGLKTAALLINEYDNLENLLNYWNFTHSLRDSSLFSSHIQGCIKSLVPSISISVVSPTSIFTTSMGNIDP